MKNRDKKLLFLNTIFIFCFTILLASSLCVLKNLNIFLQFKFAIIMIFCVVAVAFSYYLSIFLLSRFFKTNNLLKLLLKDTLHELNIPLSVIKANTQMLKNQETNDKNLKKLDRINLACDELYKLYEDIDYYIKKETKNEVREAFSLSQLLTIEIEKFEIIYPQVNIIQNVGSIELFTDKRWFSKVVGNIILNALKYNKNDNHISVYTKEHHLIIEDSGIGMSESELFVIFDRYYQGKNKKEGFGIGLSIVKAFCDEYKIPIKIESKLEQGTKINLDLDKIIKTW